MAAVKKSWTAICKTGHALGTACFFSIVYNAWVVLLACETNISDCAAIFIEVVLENVQQTVVETRFLCKASANVAIFAPDRLTCAGTMAPFVRTRQKSIVGESSDMERGVEFRSATDAAVRTKSRHVCKISERMTENAKILDFVCGERSSVIHGFGLRCRVDILDYN